MHNQNEDINNIPRKLMPGEAEKIRRIRALYGENKKINGSYSSDAAAVCRNGVFVGKIQNGVKTFKGIPYAKPPVNDLRWKPSVLPDDDTSVYEAYYFGHAPIQTEWPSEEGSYYPQSEDCLTLNIWTHIDGTNKPVMVFFHGGSYGWGATSDPLYDGHNLVSAHNDIVLVTVEYRVGMLGFIDFSNVPGGEEYKESGNLGLLDHICALKWLKQNIQAFGGNPDNVTVFGESAGGGTVSLLPLMKQSRGLFKRYIAESGSIALTYSKEECQKLTQMLLKESSSENMSDLLKLSAAEIVKINQTLNNYNNFPERDGIVLPENLYDAYKSGASKDIDFIVGTNSDEIRYWITEMGYYTPDISGELIFKLGTPLMYDANISKIQDADKKYLDRYMSLFSGRKLWKIVEFYNDILFRVPAAFQASAHSENGGKAYMYYWSYPSAHTNLGACHAVELAYIFNNLDVTIYTGNNVNEHLAKQVQHMWTNFARTGNPSTDRILWKPYNPITRETMILDSHIRMVSDHLSKRRQIIEPLLKYCFNGCYSDLKIKVPFVYKLAALLCALPAAIIILIKKIIKFFISHHGSDKK